MTTIDTLIADLQRIRRKKGNLVVMKHNRYRTYRSSFKLIHREKDETCFKYKGTTKESIDFEFLAIR